MNSKTRDSLFPMFVSIAGAIIALFPGNPSNAPVPARDSGVFLYVAWRFLSGDMPYRDIWDHKPPLVYLIDALGLTLTPNSLWGIWCVQIIFIFFTLFLTYKLLDKEFGIYAAISGTVILASGLLIIFAKGNANTTEEYALVLQVLCFGLFISAWKNNFQGRVSFWIGVLGGLAFNLKQTTIGIWITYGVILLALRLLQRKSPLRDLLLLLAGWLLPSLLFIGYFATQGTLADYWEQGFLYNFIYIGKHEGIRRLLSLFIKGFTYLRNGWVLYLTLPGWLAGLGYAWFKRKRFAEIPPLMLIALVNLPIEVLLITISGRALLHYYLTPLPVMAILTGVLVYTLPFLLSKLPGLSFEKMQRWVPGILLAVVLLGQLEQVRNYPSYVRILNNKELVPVIEYVIKNTNADDKVLVIGAESVINFMARRAAPTRYVYQYPLALLGRRSMFEEYFNQILANKPVLIIDTRGRARLDEKLYTPLQKRSQIVRDGVKYLGENYEQVAQFGEWFVYRLKDSSR